MGGVLAGKAEERGNAGGTHLLQPDEAKARDGMPAMKLGTKATRQEFLYDGGIDKEVDEKPAANEAFEVGNVQE